MIGDRLRRRWLPAVVAGLLAVSACQRQSPAESVTPQKANSPSRTAVDTAKPTERPLGPDLVGSLPLESAPSILRQFLTSNPQYRLPVLSDVRDSFEFVELYTTPDNELQPHLQRAFNGGSDPRYGVGDTNADGAPDLIAIVVKEKLFSVLAFHSFAGGPTAPAWIVTDSPEPVGAVILEKGGITPLVCFACDVNVPFRWTGAEYWLEGHVSGETACLEEGAALHERPDASSLVVHRAKGGTVLIVGPGIRNGKDRWYQVRLTQENGRVGFAQIERFLEGAGKCPEGK